jgi:high-affinity nickel-transport protein
MADTAANFFALLLPGFFLGVRHATDTDHIVAIATIASRRDGRQRDRPVRRRHPPWLGLSMELAVGLMLVQLGVLTLTGIG